MIALNIKIKENERGLLMPVIKVEWHKERIFLDALSWQGGLKS